MGRAQPARLWRTALRGPCPPPPPDPSRANPWSGRRPPQDAALSLIASDASTTGSKFQGRKGFLATSQTSHGDTRRHSKALSELLCPTPKGPEAQPEPRPTSSTHGPSLPVPQDGSQPRRPNRSALCHTGSQLRREKGMRSVTFPHPSAPAPAGRPRPDGCEGSGQGAHAEPTPGSVHRAG